MSRRRRQRSDIGAASTSWKGGVTHDGKGYRIALAPPGHPHAQSRGRIREHRLVVEGALGHYLQPSAVVHHVDDAIANNTNSNLVVLENDAEHKELHRKRRVLRAGGNPWLQYLCRTCGPLPFAAFHTSRPGRRLTLCRECVRRSNRARR